MKKNRRKEGGRKGEKSRGGKFGGGPVPRSKRSDDRIDRPTDKRTRAVRLRECRAFLLVLASTSGLNVCRLLSSLDSSMLGLAPSPSHLVPPSSPFASYRSPFVKGIRSAEPGDRHIRSRMYFLLPMIARASPSTERCESSRLATRRVGKRG